MLVLRFSGSILLLLSDILLLSPPNGGSKPTGIFATSAHLISLKGSAVTVSAPSVTSCVVFSGKWSTAGNILMKVGMDTFPPLWRMRGQNNNERRLAELTRSLWDFILLSPLRHKSRVRGEADTHTNTRAHTHTHAWCTLSLRLSEILHPTTVLP